MKKNKLKLLSVLFLFLLIIIGWLVLIDLNNLQAVGGVIIVGLCFKVISWMEQNMIIEKVKIAKNSQKYYYKNR